MDLPGTLAACRHLHARMPRLLSEEIDFVRAHDIELIAGDIPPACFEIAARAKIPSAAISNFTWDGIYRAYADEYPAFNPVAEEIARYYSRATLALALPYPCAMGIFPRLEPIPWIARRSELTREQARSKFGLPQAATIVLLSFGGIGLNVFPLGCLREMTDFCFVATGRGESLGNVYALETAQPSYEDLLRAVDVVVTKPGYGIVADVLAHRVPILYADRGNFAEYPYLVAALQDLATAEFIPQEALRGGDLLPYLHRLLSKPANWPKVSLEGAQVAADKLLQLC